MGILTTRPAPGEGCRAASSHSGDGQPGGPQREAHPTLPQSKADLGTKRPGASLGGSPSSATHRGLGPAWPVSHPEEMGAPPSCAAQTQAELITCSAAFHATVDADCSLCLTHRAGGCRHLPARRGAVRAGLPPLPPGPEAQDLGEGRGEDHTPRDLRHPSGSRTVDTCCLFSGERGGEINVESYGVSDLKTKPRKTKQKPKHPASALRPQLVWIRPVYWAQ